MKAWSTDQRLETFDEDGLLTLRVTTPAFGTRFYIAAIIAVVAFGLVITTEHYLFFGLVFLSGLYSTVQYANTQTTQCRVSEVGISSGNISLRWGEISSLEYRTAEDGPNGLYAVTGSWSGSFLMKDVDREIADRMIDIVYRRFPFAEMASQPSASLLPEEKIITLGLSDSRKPE